MADFNATRQLLRTARRRHLARRQMVRGRLVPYYRRGVLVISPTLDLPAPEPGQPSPVSGPLQRLRNALAAPSDAFLVDLEAVAADQLPTARQNSRRAIGETAVSDRVYSVRVHGLRSLDLERDLADVVIPVWDRLDTLVLPGVESADEVRDFKILLRTAQRARGAANRVGIEVLIQSPRAFLAAEAIAQIEDVTALILDAGELARTTGALTLQDTAGHPTAEHPTAEHPTAEHPTARCGPHALLPILAAAHGKEAIDALSPPPAKSAPGTPWVRARAQEAHALGYAACWAHAVRDLSVTLPPFTPSRAEAITALDQAVRFVRARAGEPVFAPNESEVETGWTRVRAALCAGLLTPADIEQTGTSLGALERVVRALP